MDYRSIYDITKSLNILYVEDNIIVCEETAEMLKEYFENVSVCADGEEGLEAYERFYLQNGKHYDIVLTDINMPILNGIDMSKEILMINPSQVIVIVTALGEPNYVRELREIGIKHTIKKPAYTKEMLELLSLAVS